MNINKEFMCDYNDNHYISIMKELNNNGYISKVYYYNNKIMQVIDNKDFYEISKDKMICKDFSNFIKYNNFIKSNINLCDDNYCMKISYISNNSDIRTKQQFFENKNNSQFIFR
mgnify:CR=1 FL=1